MAASDDGVSPSVEHELSVCVIVRSDDAPLPRMLASLTEQSALPGSFDVVVVDATNAGLDVAVAGTPRVTVVRADQATSRAALHDLAWQTATAPSVAFVGVDLVPAPMWAEAMMRALRRGRRVVTGGWLPNPDTLDQTGIASYRLWVSPHEVALATADQLGCLRSDLERAGGFATDFDDASADVELVARLVDVGAEPFWARHAVVYADVTDRTLGEMLGASRRAAETVRVLDEHPRARGRMLLGGLLWHRRQAEALLALAGLAFAGRDRRALLLVAPWLHERTCLAPAAGGRRRRWFVLPGVFAADVYHLTTTTRSRLAPRSRKP
jgi:hypothetical protein